MGHRRPVRQRATISVFGHNAYDVNPKTRVHGRPTASDATVVHTSWFQGVTKAHLQRALAVLAIDSGAAASEVAITTRARRWGVNTRHELMQLVVEREAACICVFHALLARLAWPAWLATLRLPATYAWPK
jgi:hypothetical protein